jgi:hypothetical protein
MNPGRSSGIVRCPAGGESDGRPWSANTKGRTNDNNLPAAVPENVGSFVPVADRQNDSSQSSRGVAAAASSRAGSAATVRWNSYACFSSAVFMIGLASSISSVSSRVTNE